MKRIILFYTLLYLIGIITIIDTIIFGVSYNSHPVIVEVEYYYIMLSNIVPIFISISFIVLLIVNIINAIELFLCDDVRMGKYAKIVKLAYIPFILLIIIHIIISQYYISFSFIFGPKLDMLMWYLILVITSSYSFFYIMLLKKKNIITKNQLRLHIVLQTVIIVDIIDILYLTKKYKIEEMSNIA
jgi:hypothetical protein